MHCTSENSRFVHLRAPGCLTCTSTWASKNNPVTPLEIIIRIHLISLGPPWGANRGVSHTPCPVHHAGTCSERRLNWWGSSRIMFLSLCFTPISCNSTLLRPDATASQIGAAAAGRLIWIIRLKGSAFSHEWTSVLPLIFITEMVLPKFALSG